jgi:hypothetical protein
MSSANYAVADMSISDGNSSDPEKNAPSPPTKEVEEEVEDESGYVTGIPLGLIILGLSLAGLLIGLVLLILLPK